MPEAERRSDGGGPPTMVMQAYREMDKDDKDKMERLGYGMIVVSVGVPIVAGVFYELEFAYWVFAAAAGSIGVAFVFPALGVWFIDVALRFAAKVVPALRPKLRPDRRGENEG